MIEVVPHGNGFVWRMICAAGRTLVESADPFPCIMSAATAAKDYRARFWAYASTVDHRMAVCI